MRGENIGTRESHIARVVPGSNLDLKDSGLEVKDGTITVVETVLGLNKARELASVPIVMDRSNGGRKDSTDGSSLTLQADR